MERLDYQQDRLGWEGHDLTHLGDRFQTPTYVYSRRRLEENHRRFDQAFAEIPHLICYSVKANSNLKIISLLVEMGAGMDIVSGGELQRALRGRRGPGLHGLLRRRQDRRGNQRRVDLRSFDVQRRVRRRARSH